MIKHTLIAVVFLTSFSFVGLAQESGLGAKGGLNFATMRGDVDDAGTRTSIHLGGYYTHMFTDELAVQAEFLYSGQGYKSTEDSSKFTGKFNYLNIPFIAKYYVTEEISLHGGLQFGLLLGATAEGDGFSGSISNVSGLDVSLGLGAGYELESGLNFGIRYNLGLSNVYDGPGDASYRNSVIQLSVGYRFTEDALF